MGIKVRNNDFEEIHFAPYINAIDFSKELFENKRINWTEFSAKILSIQDKNKGKDIGGLLDIDIFGELLIETSKNLNIEIKGFLKEIFDSIDVFLIKI